MKRLVRFVIAATVFLLLLSILGFSWLFTTNSGLQWAWQQVQTSLTAELEIKALEGKLAGPVTLHDIHFQQQGRRITVKQLVVDWHPAMLFGGVIDVNKIHARSVNIFLPASAAKAEGGQSKPVTLPEIDLPWRIVLKGVVIDDLDILQDDASIRLQQAYLDADVLFNHIDIQQLRVKSDIFDIKLWGGLHPTQNYRHELETQWQFTLPNRNSLSGNGRIEGNVLDSIINQHVEGALALSLEASVTDLLHQPQWQAKIQAQSHDISRLRASWPNARGRVKLAARGNLTTAYFNGEMRGDFPRVGPFESRFGLTLLEDASIDVDHLDLHVLTSATRINARGRWKANAEGGDADLALHWQNLRWPLTDDAWFNSAVGSGWITGSPGHYHLGFATDRPWSQAPSSFWFGAAKGNQDGIDFHELRISALEGETTIRGRLDWAPLLRWDAEISLAGVNPAVLQPKWPGKLRGTLHSKGRYASGQWAVDADIRQIEGELRGYPLSLRSRMSWRDNGLDIGHVDLRSADSKLALHGRVAEHVNLKWLIHSADLAQLYPDAGGQLDAYGSLSGDRQTPNIRAEFKGRGLHLLDYTAEGIEGLIDVDLMRWQQIDIQFEAQALTANAVPIQSIQIKADHRHLQSKVKLQEMELLLVLRGHADKLGWRGEINTANLNSHRFGVWQLTAPAALSLTADEIKLGSLCWRQQAAQLCSALDRQDGGWHGVFHFNALPLALLSPWLPAELELQGVIDGEGKLSYNVEEQVSGYVDISLPPGTIKQSLLEKEGERWRYRGGTLALTLDNTGVEARAVLGINNGDRLQASLRLPGARLPTVDILSQPLEVEAKLNIHDLSLLEALLTDVQDLRGEIAVDLNATGTLDQPRFSGRAELTNGSLQIPRLGLNIKQLDGEARSEGHARINYQLNAHSGEGTLALQGQTTLDRSSGWPTTLNVKGDRFEVSRIPEALLQVSPDLNVNIQKRTVRVHGQLHIPYAKLQPKDMTSATRESDDTVIIGGEQLAVEKWLVYTRIRLTLGERVNFFGFGFEGRFGGSLLLEDEPGQLTRATGELSIPEGRYRAYGQRLEVEHGRLLYTGGPLSNPGLNFRSVRRIGNITAGLNVKGTLNQPWIELFTIPAMGQTDALSYLLLGRPLENASGEEGAMMAKATLALGIMGGDRLARTLGNRFGLDEMRVETSEAGDQASLVIGRYLSPRLYISYGVGLVEAINTFSVRYQISDKWQLKGESGEHQGADLLYTIER